MPKPGARVFAIFETTETEVRMFGFGTYIGNEVPEVGVKMFGIDMHAIGVENPCIVLDNGKKVYGCECWWGDESLFETGGKIVVVVDIDNMRIESA